jgi:hypothetical protein
MAQDNLSQVRRIGLESSSISGKMLVGDQYVELKNIRASLSFMSLCVIHGFSYVKRQDLTPITPITQKEEVSPVRPSSIGGK